MTITAEQALRELRELAAEQPEFVYTSPGDGMSCLYVHDYDEDDEHCRSEPGCLIGVWLHTRHGISLDQLREHNSESADHLLGVLSLDIEPEVKIIANLAQDRQDNGWSWGKAVERTADYADFLLENSDDD